jgi:hypothetical protein
MRLSSRGSRHCPRRRPSPKTRSLRKFTVSHHLNGTTRNHGTEIIGNLTSTPRIRALGWNEPRGALHPAPLNQHLNKFVYSVCQLIVTTTGRSSRDGSELRSSPGLIHRKSVFAVPTNAAPPRAPSSFFTPSRGCSFPFDSDARRIRWTPRSARLSTPLRSSPVRVVGAPGSPTHHPHPPHLIAFQRRCRTTRPLPGRPSRRGPAGFQAVAIADPEHTKREVFETFI